MTNKPKKYTVTLRLEYEVEVTLPPFFDGDKFIEDWERGLYFIEGETTAEKFKTLAADAAISSVLHPGINEDGFGVIETYQLEKPDYEKTPYLVTAITNYEDFSDYDVEEIAQ